MLRTSDMHARIRNCASVVNFETFGAQNIKYLRLIIQHVVKVNLDIIHVIEGSVTFAEFAERLQQERIPIFEQ